LWLPLLYRRIAVALIAVFALLVGSAAAALAQSPKPDPAPAAQHQQTTPPASTSSGSTHVNPSPAPAPTYTPAPVVTPAPATSSAPVSTPSTSQPATTTAPKHKVTHRAKAKAATKKAHHAKPAVKKAKPVVRPAKPAPPRPVVRSAPAIVSTTPFVPPADSAGSSLSNRSVLLIAFVLVIGVGVLALAVRGLWRRVWWWRRYHESASGGRPVRSDDAVIRARAALLQSWPDDAKANGANGLAPDDEPATIATRAAADDGYR
jgi:hypothetical protein